MSVNPDKMLREARAESADLTNKLNNVQRLIRVLEDMTTGTSEGDNREINAVTDDYPKPREAVLRAISRAPGLLMEPKDVTASVREMGMFNPSLKSGSTAYSTALARLAEEPGSKVRRHGDGYVFLTPHDVAQFRDDQEFAE